MPGGITLLESISADIPTPVAGKDTIFINSATGQPSYKDSSGVVHTLVGTAGAIGPTGLTGPIGFGIDGEDGDVIIIPGPSGIAGATGATGPTGSQGPPSFSDDNASNNDEIYPPAANISSQLGIRTITVAINGGGSVITTGFKAYLQIPLAVTILSWTIIGQDGLTGSIVLDIWSDTYANFPPTVGDTITASAKPTISSAKINTSATLTGWTTTIPAGNVIGFNVDSVTTFQSIILELIVKVN